VKYVIAYVAVCAVWFVIGTLVAFPLRAWHARRVDRRGQVAEQNSQLEITKVHHIDQRTKPTVDRPRVKDPSGK
jgi:hypothetical protein